MSPELTQAQNHSLAKLVQKGAEGGTKITYTNDLTKNFSVYGTPDIHQRIAENIAHLQRPETKNVRFVMEINYTTLGDFQGNGTGRMNNVLWKKNRLGLITIETGTGKLPPPSIAEKIGDGIENPLHPYLRPITSQKGKKTHSGIEFYWVAKENISKMQHAWNKHVHNLKGDSRFRDSHWSQQVKTSNGQQGIYVGDVSFPFTLSEKKWYKSSPTYENFLADKMFSLVGEDLYHFFSESVKGNEKSPT
jgi:hypothetical protein